MASPAAEVADLRRQIEYHNRLYYVESRTEISDREFDELMRRLKELERLHPELDSPDSPSHKVGGEPIEGFHTVEHQVPMLSIDNAFSEEEVREFDRRVRKLLQQESVEYSIEYKIDGVALAAVYEQGVLQRAVTRGDGRQGDDITNNARTLGGLPLKLHGDDFPDSMEVRGEAYITNSDFAHLRAEQQRASRELFANPRNTAAGGLKLLDPKLCAARRIRFLAHGVGAHDDLGVSTYSEFLDLLKRLGIPTTPGVALRQGIDAALEYCTTMMEGMHALNLEVDGIVIKVNDFALREELGATSKSPRWVIAYKWEKYEAVTRMNNIEVTVGKSGAITPAAILEPVLIAGSTISRASLHNRDELARLGVMIGDWVVVEKAGKVIPHVVRVEEHQRDGTQVPFVFPERCPECGGEIVQDEGGVSMRCINPTCPAQLRESLRFFASRQAMDIDGLGIKLIEQLIAVGLLTSFADVYRLPEHREQMLQLERLGAKSVDNLLQGIEKSKSRPLWRLLTALNIRHIGASNAQRLAKTFGTLDELRAQSEDALADVEDVGPIIAHSVYEFFHSDVGNMIVEDLRTCGLNFGTPIAEQPADDKGEQPLAGMSIVVTGTLARFKRDEIKELITRLGGKAAGSVSSKTNLLVAGSDAGSKLEAARELGVEVITEDEFLKRIGGDT